MELKEIKSLIRLISSKNDIYELNIKLGEFEIHIKKNKIYNHLIKKRVIDESSYIDESSSYKSDNVNKIDNNSKCLIIRSPMIGTFYRQSSPEEKPYVNIGDIISPGLKLCIIESMKLFNNIESEVSGKIKKILVEDNNPVEYDQPLFLIDPC